MALQEMEESVHIKVDSVVLEGIMGIPKDAFGLVVFAHGSGSSRHSPRNNFVAKELRNACLGTLLVDLLTQEEDRVYETRFDITLLTRRLEGIIHWLDKQPQTKNLPKGFFGASTGAAAALMAAAKLGPEIKGVVSRGGRPDLAGNFLDQVEAPTLLIVGGEDFPVLELNRKAYDRLQKEKEYTIIPGATHLFEEPGTLEEVARLTARWFSRHFPSSKP